jgi:hypothetical protein
MREAAAGAQRVRGAALRGAGDAWGCPQGRGAELTLNCHLALANLSSDADGCGARRVPRKYPLSTP